MSDSSSSPRRRFDHWMNQFAIGMVGSIAVVFAISAHSLLPALGVVAAAAVWWLIFRALRAWIELVERRRRGRTLSAGEAVAALFARADAPARAGKTTPLSGVRVPDGWPPEGIVIIDCITEIPISGWTKSTERRWGCGFAQHALLPVAMIALSGAAGAWSSLHEIDSTEYDALSTAMPAASTATRRLVLKDLVEGNGEINRWRYQELAKVVMNDVGWLQYRQEPVADQPIQRARLKSLAERDSQ